MEDILRPLIGQKVRVFSAWGDGEKSDLGKLVSYDERWLCLSKDGEMLYFSLSHIRLFKPA